MKRKLKILFVIPYFAPAWGGGGPAKLSFDYAKELIKKGHKVTVYTSDVQYKKERIIKKHDFLDGIEVYYLENLSNYLACKRIYLPLGFPKLLRETICNFDIIHCFDFRTLQNIWIRNEAIRTKIPYVVSVFGQMNRGSGIRGLLKLPYDFLWGKKFLENATLIFAQNNHEKEDLLNFSIKEEKIALLPLAIDFSEFEKLPKRGFFRKKYGIKYDDFLILFVGRLHPFKGVDLLINSLALILKKIPEAKLAIVGRDDGDLKRLKKLRESLNLEKKIIFSGPIYEKERINAYVDADVFVITPKHFEETSLASLEAAACQTPIIVNQKCQVPYLEEYKAGITIPDSNSQSISEVIFEILKNKEKRGSNARVMIREKFSLDRIITQLINYYIKSLKSD